MAFEVNTGSTSIDFGADLKIGYRPNGSAGAFVYLTPLPNYNQLPYTFSLPSAGVWDIEYTQICASCSGSVYSEPQVVTVIVT